MVRPGVDRMVWRGVYEPIETAEGTLHDSIVATARAMGDRVSLIDGPSGVTTTYAELASRIDRAAAGLAARGLRPGDVLALWAPNSPGWAIAALGAVAAGATVSGVSPVAVERELAAQLMDSEASIVVAPPDRLELARKGARTAVDLDPATAVALLPYSSGTTGLPKGVMLTHANVVVAIAQARAGLKLGPRDTVVAVAPFAHVMGFV